MEAIEGMEVYCLEIERSAKKACLVSSDPRRRPIRIWLERIEIDRRVSRGYLDSKRELSKDIVFGDTKLRHSTNGPYF